MSRRRWPLALLLVVALHPQSRAWLVPSPAPPYRVATVGWAHVFFTSPPGDGSRSPLPGLDAVLAADIAAARRSVEIAAFDIDLPRLRQALLAARQRGLRVALAVDAENMADPHMAELVGALELAGAHVAVDRRSAFMHHKIVLLDRQLVWAGSMNFTESDVYLNNNNMLRTAAAPLVANYAQRMDHLLAGRMGRAAPQDTPYPDVRLATGARVQSFFSPGSGGDRLVEARLAAAHRSIDVLAFVLTARPQVALLAERHAAGVAVRVVVEERNATGSGSALPALRAAGVPLRLDGNCRTLHHKVYIIDGRTVITGSYNFTNNAEQSNDENLLIIDDPALARLYAAEFARLYAQAAHPPRCQP